MLTVQEQQQFINLLDQSPGLQDSIEALLNCKLEVMTYQQKVAAVHEFLEVGHATAAIAQAAKAMNDLRNLAGQARGDVSLSDRVRMLEAQVQNKEEQLASAKDREHQLSVQITTLVDQIVELKAQPAAAVHSSD